jgi:hypothetical protein
MSNVIYAIIYKGEIIDGFQLISVKANLAKLLKIDAKKMAALFSGKQIVIKRTADKTQAVKYAKALKRVGADIKVRAIKQSASQSKAQAKTQARTQARTQAKKQLPNPDKASTWGLAPNKGFIVKPAAPVPAPDLDLSGISIAENDGTFLVEPADAEYLDLDLSEYSVQENDGSPLVEASTDEVPIIEAPDFGLDEPGDVMDTIPDDRELLDPNTKGMSLAATGSDLLEPKEKDQKPPPKAPDTSAFELVPNVD